MNVQDMVKNWDTWGREDPMYSILTDRNKANRGWNAREFFETGEKQIDRKIAWFRENGIEVHFDTALDFGCGLGRLTNALAKYFKTVHGVDISQTMIEQARDYCRYPHKVQYYQNARADLSTFKTGEYDLVYSEISLQHAPTSYQVSYIRDFMRLLSPHGIACFQTLRAVRWRALVPNFAIELCYKKRHKERALIPMYPIRLGTVARIISRAGCRQLSHQTAVPENCAARFCGDIFVVAKRFGRTHVSR